MFASSPSAASRRHQRWHQANKRTLSPGGRDYTEVLPQAGAVPAAVFTEVSGEDDVVLDGPTGESARRVQIDSWGRTRADATALGLTVCSALAGHTGAAAGRDVQGCFLVAERWNFDAEAALYGTSQDFDVWNSDDAA